MTSKPAPQWLIPLATGETIVLRLGSDDQVELGVAERPGGALLRPTALEAAFLSLALQEASKEAGQRAARRKR